MYFLMSQFYLSNHLALSSSHTQSSLTVWACLWEFSSVQCAVCGFNHRCPTWRGSGCKKTASDRFRARRAPQEWMAGVCVAWGLNSSFFFGASLPLVSGSWSVRMHNDAVTGKCLASAKCRHAVLTFKNKYIKNSRMGSDLCVVF